jgi:hypothetical protein
MDEILVVFGSPMYQLVEVATPYMNPKEGFELSTGNGVK